MLRLPMTSARCSIVIPVQNRAGLTHRCLDSIFSNPPEVPFDVVVVGDASTDSTPELLSDYGGAIREIALDENAGFATACKKAAAACESEFVLFLDSGTIALEGWLDALVEYADQHPKASVVGSRLLSADDTIRHTGVAFTLFGDPFHIYANCAADHPAVNRSRRFQAVTSACLLIRREAFEAVGGFDTGYDNHLEGVDLCLRLGELGHEIHYCHRSALYQLEPDLRGQAARAREGARRYRRRWGNRVQHDELAYYLDDGLLDLLRPAPELLPSARGKRKHEVEVLQVRLRQLMGLLRETICLSTFAADAPVERAGRGAPQQSAGATRLPPAWRRSPPTTNANACSRGASRSSTSTQPRLRPVCSIAPSQPALAPPCDGRRA